MLFPRPTAAQDTASAIDWLLLAVFMFTNAQQANSALIGISGDFQPLLNPPASVALNALESDDDMLVFVERDAYTLQNTLTAVIAQANQSYSGVSIPAAGTIDHGAIVDEFFIHADPLFTSSSYSGTLTFDRDILAIVATDGQMDSSDSEFALPSTTYPPASLAKRGLENFNDQVSISADRRTLTLNLQVVPELISVDDVLEQIRVVTASVQQATQFNWNAQAGGDWGVPTNWHVGLVPDGPDVDVTFDEFEPYTVNLSAVRTARSVTMRNATVQLTDAGGGGLTLTVDASVDASGNDHEIAVPISGTSELNKAGDGTLIISGLNQYTGGTKIQDGTLWVRNHQLPDGTITIESEATLFTNDFVSYDLLPGQVLGGGGEFLMQHEGAQPVLAVGNDSEVRGNLWLSVSGLRNGGLVAPGSVNGDAAGTIVVDGDYAGLPEGTLEIELGGLNAQQHDQVVVAAAAQLGGRLDLRLSDGFPPLANDTFVIMTASSLSGQFDALLAPPEIADAGLALDIDVGGTPGEVRLRFVAPSASIGFAGQAVSANWTAGFNWEGGVPGPVDALTVGTNQDNFDQELTIDSGVLIHQLTIESAGSNSMTVNLLDGGNLSTTGQVVVESGGILQADGGSLLSNGLQILPGGRFRGYGRLTGDVTLGSDSGSEPAILEPVENAGNATLEVVGDYLQAGNARLSLDISGTELGQFDQLLVSGTMTPGGTLEIVFTDPAAAEPGNSWDLIVTGDMTADAEFDLITVLNLPDGVFAAVDTSPDLNTLHVLRVGDMNRDEVIDQLDVPLFAQALFNPGVRNPQFGWTGDEAGDFDFNNRLDFDDVDEFASLVDGMSTSAVLAAIFSTRPNIPEPSTISLFLVSAAVFVIRRRQVVDGVKR